MLIIKFYSRSFLFYYMKVDCSFYGFVTNKVVSNVFKCFLYFLAQYFTSIHK